MRPIYVVGKWKMTHLRGNEEKMEVKWRVSNRERQKFGISVVGSMNFSRISAPGAQHVLCNIK